MDIKQALTEIVSARDLSTEDMVVVMRQIMSGGASDAQIGAFLMGMRLKGETIDEITGAVQVMRELAKGVSVSGDYLVDIVGTGGDGANLFNVSTAASLVVAAAGGKVAKHGNRSVSSSCGSADVLEASGVRLDLTPEQVTFCVDECGVGFMFAPGHHSAMRHAIGPRKDMGMRTLFNVLGPMTNPAGVKRQLIGVFDKALCRPVAEVLHRMGAEHVLVVHSNDGLDEISLATDTFIVELKDGDIIEFEFNPASAGIDLHALSGLSVDNVESALSMLRSALAAEGNAERNIPAASIVALNAGAALYVCGLQKSIHDGVIMALDTLNSGEALRKLDQLAAITQSF